jgi:chromosome segregation ATPase
MNPELTQRAKAAAELARSLELGLSSANPVAKSAAALAAECLELAVSPFAWQSGHEVVRDLGVRELRESVQRDCASALRLAAESARRLGVHGGSAERHAAIAARLEQLEANLMRTTAGLDACEQQIIDRVAEPRLAEISLQQRNASLRLTPSEQVSRLKELSADLERRLADAAGSRAALGAVEARLREAEEETRANSVGLAQAEAALQLATRELESIKRALRDAEFTRDDLEIDRRNASERLAQVRRELEALRDDPRDAVRDAVRRAIVLLPADSFDRAVGGSNAG